MSSGKCSDERIAFGGDGTELLGQEFVHLEAVAFRPHLIRLAARAVIGVAVAPVVEAGAVRDWASCRRAG